MPDNSLYIGLMSGTSVDSIDVALVDLSGDKAHLLKHHEQPISSKLKNKILALCQPGNNEIDLMGALDRQLGEEFGLACNQLINNSGLQSTDITAIGSHGQTIRHRPRDSSDNNYPFTLQIGDPNTIAEITGITTVGDFRRRDMAAGGQGAPLAPAFHRAFFHSSSISRAVVNIGGMSNVSFLPAKGNASGFDTGPGNVLLDAWIALQQNKRYDRDGEWAASGKSDPALLEQLLAHPYFQASAPKSTGREAFNLSWLESQLKTSSTDCTSADIQATLLELTAGSIAADIDRFNNNIEVYICGGGAYNKQLMVKLREYMPQNIIASTSALGLAPEWVEAVAFAWLAKQTLNRLPGNLPAVTGANRALTLGGIYFAS